MHYYLPKELNLRCHFWRTLLAPRRLPAASVTMDFVIIMLGLEPRPSSVASHAVVQGNAKAGAH